MWVMRYARDILCCVHGEEIFIICYLFIYVIVLERGRGHEVGDFLSLSIGFSYWIILRFAPDLFAMSLSLAIHYKSYFIIH
mmetsp:Transcript_1824/g.2453  ORF Transcript_1824/g.2453 Transcript_1824/m.2453 type:complete len:81 (-) Transcript_1824:9-251(-)